MCIDRCCTAYTRRWNQQGEERAAALYPGYDGYAQRARREIPVVGLEATGG